MIKHKITYYDNYIIKTSTEYVNDEITTYIEYDPNGEVTHKRTPSTIENYKDGKPHGKVIIYHDNGNIHLYKIFNNGKHKLEKRFYENGTKFQIKKYYNNGKLAIAKTYNLKGKLSFENYYTEDLNIDISMRIDYHDNGKIRDIGNYIDGHLNGTAIKFFPNKKIQEIANYRDYKKNGLRKIYHDNGNLFCNLTYINGITLSFKSEFFDEIGNPLDITKIENLKYTTKMI
jgi:antitoxin component YwqK of YwqJK toxin-antitoxin module